MPRPDFPLEEEAITAALEQTGLAGTISEDETQSYTEERRQFVLRSEDQKLTSFISSALHDGGRLLQIDFFSPSVPEGPAFAWEDWKQQLVFAALLFGGFADEEELYRAFSEQEAAGGALPPAEGAAAKMTAERYKWDAQLAAGYCRVFYELANTEVESSSLGTRVLSQSPRMYLIIYESESLYEDIQEEIRQAKAEADRAREEAILKQAE